MPYLLIFTFFLEKFPLFLYNVYFSKLYENKFISFIKKTLRRLDMCEHTEFCNMFYFTPFYIDGYTK